MKLDNKNFMDLELNKIIGEEIKHIRTIHNISTVQLAKKLNNKITRQTISNYENATCRIKNDIFVEICIACNEDPNEVYDRILMKYIKSSK